MKHIHKYEKPLKTILRLQSYKKKKLKELCIINENIYKIANGKVYINLCKKICDLFVCTVSVAKKFYFVSHGILIYGI